ncbi:MAG TPA: acetyl-CoA C-acetyltransferase [Candidatus Marinimicrobia bacterium]|jgi:acetyl-CoA C-acetyltransferase|nr:acetyl-CoA C-acetyltransferase [Candidatus Neomarinimicrobiota bacterium]HIN25889.1 acetyl-CoA C-acetyltransferase [Candidatus Neomarinimicrobiota bacterium]
MVNEAFIFDALRTPRGKRKNGALNEITPADLAAKLLSKLQQKHSLDTAHVDDVVMGCVTPIGDQGGNIGKTAAQYAGWDVDVPGMQVNRFCATGLETVNMAAMKIRSGWEDLVVAGGIECMSRTPMGSDGGAMAFEPKVNLKTSFVPQGIGADLIATIENFSRDDVDNYALESQKRAAKATNKKYFKSLVPIEDQNGLSILEHDEHIRHDITIEGLKGLNPSFEMMGNMGYDAVALQKYTDVETINHVHTAGNSSGIVDGAAIALVGSAEKGKSLGIRPRAKVLAAATVATDPTIMLTGPGPATKKALNKARMSIKDIDLMEVNEAFAVVVLRFLRDMELDSMDNVNVNGGSIAMGHPLGATGAMLLGTALDELERSDLQTALITLCVGGGMGIATIIERV